MFWVYGVATSVTIVALYVIAFYDGRIALRQVLLPCFGAYTAWILVSVLAMRKQHERKTLEYTRALPDRRLGRKHDSCSDLFATQPFDKIFATLSNSTTYP